jgi:hypothetical protein
MERVIRDLELIFQENIKLLAAPDGDVAEYQKWGARRAVLFTHLQDFQLASDELAAAASLIKEITRLDAEILCRLEQNLLKLGEKISAAAKVQQALAHTGGSHHAALMERVV